MPHLNNLKNKSNNLTMNRKKRKRKRNMIRKSKLKLESLILLTQQMVKLVKQHRSLQQLSKLIQQGEKLRLKISHQYIHQW